MRKARRLPRPRNQYEFITQYLAHWACFACKKAYKQPYGASGVCPQCGQSMENMGMDFRAPRQKDTEQWAKVERLAGRGVRFWPEGEGGPGTRPVRLRDVEAFLGEQPKSEAERLLTGQSRRSRASVVPEGQLLTHEVDGQREPVLLGTVQQDFAPVEVFVDGGWRRGQWRNLQLSVGDARRPYVDCGDRRVIVKDRTRLRPPRS